MQIILSWQPKYEIYFLPNSLHNVAMVLHSVGQMTPSYWNFMPIQSNSFNLGVNFRNYPTTICFIHRNVGILIVLKRGRSKDDCDLETTSNNVFSCFHRQFLNYRRLLLLLNVRMCIHLFSSSRRGLVSSVSAYWSQKPLGSYPRSVIKTEIRKIFFRRLPLSRFLAKTLRANKPAMKKVSQKKSVVRSQR